MARCLTLSSPKSLFSGIFNIRVMSIIWFIALVASFSLKYLPISEIKLLPLLMGMEVFVICFFVTTNFQRFCHISKLLYHFILGSYIVFYKLAKLELQIIFRKIIILRHYNSSQHFKSKKIPSNNSSINKVVRRLNSLTEAFLYAIPLDIISHRFARLRRAFASFFLLLAVASCFEVPVIEDITLLSL